MPASILISGDGSPILEVVDEVLAARCYEPGEVAGEADLTLRVETFSNGVCIRSDDWTSTLRRALAASLVGTTRSSRLTFVEVEAGSRGELVIAEAVHFEPGQDPRDIDLTRDAREILDEWIQEGGITEEHEASMQLLDILTADYVLEGSFTLEYVLTVSPRMAPLVSSLMAGAEWSWIEIGGQRALEIVGEGEKSIAVLSQAEFEEIRPWLQDE